MITITDMAKTKILEFMKSEQDDNLALRVSIVGRGPGGFQNDLQFVEPQEKNPDDVVIDAGGFEVLIDPKSAESLKGSTLDYVDSPLESGFKITNPNPLWPNATAQAVQDVIDSKINPGLAGHGGFITLLDVRDTTAYISLGGGCQGCGMVDVTLKQGIEVMIREEVPEIDKIVDTTDHAGGSNPYYQPSKGGGSSPLT